MKLYLKIRYDNGSKSKILKETIEIDRMEFKYFIECVRDSPDDYQSEIFTRIQRIQEKIKFKMR